MAFEGDEVRDLVHCLYAAIDRNDRATLEAVVSQRVVVEVGGGGPVGWDQWIGCLDEFFTAFPDGRHELDEVLVDGSHGVSRCRFVGTHTGEFRGIAPTGNAVSVAGIHIDRFQGDMLVTHRGQLDMYGLYQQLEGA
ncbi:ester cyclase [Mycobacterium sp. NPDC051804]|uniref:ester cyclase n=1 Tax=Mycobacterium sp. NPDC051804 TaxID=3364295 RepID=UPI00379E47A6